MNQKPFVDKSNEYCKAQPASYLTCVTQTSGFSSRQHSFEDFMTYDNRLTTALLLAAGTGSRLRPLTLDSPKCLTEVGGQTILGRLTDNLQSQGIRRLVVVTGYLDHRVREYLKKRPSGLQVDFVFNPIYQTTNNIYSLWLARQAVQEPFMLIESDLVFDESMTKKMLTPNKIAISRILPWMNGTTVELNAREGVSAIRINKDVRQARQYKTVNICSLSLPAWRRTISRLDRYIADNRVGEYYESVLADMVADGTLEFDAVFFDENRWYEIDTLKDLAKAELLFPRSRQIAATERWPEPLAPDLQGVFADQNTAA